jgi:hypothetical protein
VASPPYFTTAELRQLPDLADAARYTDLACQNAHDWIVGIVERVCDTSFVTRTYTDTVDGSRVGADGSLRLLHRYVQQVTDIAINGVSLTPDALAAIAVFPEGAVVRYRQAASFDAYGASGSQYAYVGAGGGLAPWPAGFRNITVSYLAGYSSAPPADLRQAMLQAARYRLVNVEGKSGIPSRALSITNDLGNISLASASLTRPTGIPDVDAVVLGWAENVRIPGVA